MDDRYKKYFRNTKCRIAPLLAKLFGNREILGAEIGVYRGKNAMHLLESMPKLTLMGVDMWDLHYLQNNEEYYKHTKDRTANRLAEQGFAIECYNIAKLRVANYSDRCELLRLSSEDASKTCADGYFDFVYIDASHKYKDCKADIKLWLPKIKIGGYISGHDYNINRHKGVRKAVNGIQLLTGFDLINNKNTNGEWLMGPIIL